MPYPFRGGRGARGVVDPAAGMVIGRWRGQRGRIAHRQTQFRSGHAGQVDRSDLEPGVPGDRPRHGLMVETPPCLRNEKQAGADLPGDVPDFLLPQQRNDRVLHCADARERDQHDGRLEDRRQLPGHDVTRRTPNPAATRSAASRSWVAVNFGRARLLRAPGRDAPERLAPSTPRGSRRLLVPARAGRPRLSPTVSRTQSL